MTVDALGDPGITTRLLVILPLSFLTGKIGPKDRRLCEDDVG